MTTSPGRIPALVSLVPQSGIQFLDIAFSADRLPRAAMSFWEEPLPAGADANRGLVSLRVLRADETGELLDPVSGAAPPPDDVYQVGRNQALEPFVGRWVPLPYFRVAAMAAGGREVHEKGPTNLARARIVELPAPDRDGNTHLLTLAFDTGLRSR